MGDLKVEVDKVQHVLCSILLRPCSFPVDMMVDLLLSIGHASGTIVSVSRSSPENAKVGRISENARSQTYI